MRHIMLKDWQWVAKVEYKNHPDSHIYFPATKSPDMLSAIAELHIQLRECWPYEIISLQQEIYDDGK